MRVMFLTQWFEPEPAFKGLSFVKALIARGLSVDVVTGFPNYPRGKIYPGYRLRLLQKQLIDEVQVTRLFLYPSHSASSVGRALNYLSFFFSTLAYGLWACRRYDSIYVYHPPMTVGAAAAIFTWVTGRPFIIDIQDLWPDSVTASGMKGSRFLTPILGKMCRFVYARATTILAQSRGIREALIARGVEPKKIRTVLNWADEESTIPLGRFDASALLPATRFNLVYAGNLGRVQRLDLLIDAARLAALSEPRLLLTLIGDGVEGGSLRELAKSTEHVAVRSSLPRSEIADLLVRADALVAHLENNPLFDITIPSKLPFYLAMGKPVLAGLAGEAARIVIESGAGVIADPCDVDSLAGAMIDLARRSAHNLEQMGSKGRQFYSERLSRQAGLDATVEAIRRLPAEPRGGLALFIKRLIDITGALTGIVILSPVMLVLAGAILVFMGRPILFCQTRPGLNGKPFLMLKFRSMSESVDRDGRLLADAARVTKLGAFLRSSSLDEAPELWNVLRGEMSLVGPRPLLMQYLDRYNDEQRRRHNMPPGMTGWAQVNGRNRISWPEKFALDVWYIDNWSLMLDFRILLMTVSRVLRRSNIDAGDGVTMPEFMGDAAERERPAE